MAYTDNTFFPASMALLTCLTTAADDISVPPLHKALRAGAAVAFDLSQNADLCCEGLAYVRQGDIFPSSDFPAADNAAQTCFPVWAVELEMGIIRCMPVGTAQEPVTDDEHLATALLLSEDVAALRRTLCCFKDAWPYAMVIGRLSPVGPEGGCVGYVASLTAQVIPRDPAWP